MYVVISTYFFPFFVARIGHRTSGMKKTSVTCVEFTRCVILYVLHETLLAYTACSLILFYVAFDSM